MIPEPRPKSIPGTTLWKVERQMLFRTSETQSYLRIIETRRLLKSSYTNGFFRFCDEFFGVSTHISVLISVK